MRLPLTLLLLFSHQLCAAVMIKEHQWPQNSELNVVFLDGSTELKSLVKRYSILWVEKSNLSFHFYDSLNEAPVKKHIRVSFTRQNASSLGDQGNHHDNYATMNLFDLTSDQISANGAKRLILHEFGHAIGLEHEFRNPNWPYKDLAFTKIIIGCLPKMITIGYSKKNAKIHCIQISNKLKNRDAISTAYDQNSIMNYALRFKNKNETYINIKARSELSFLDSYAIQKWYPKD